jgi:hypothetical protein
LFLVCKSCQKDENTFHKIKVQKFLDISNLKSHMQTKPHLVSLNSFIINEEIENPTEENKKKRKMEEERKTEEEIQNKKLKLPKNIIEEEASFELTNES